MHTLARRRPRGFTMLELIVVIVILGILALLAIPTFDGVLNRSETSTAENGALAIGRSAQASASFDSEYMPSEAQLDAAAVEAGLTGAAATVTDDVAGTATVTVDGTAVDLVFAEGSVSLVGSGEAADNDSFENAIAWDGSEMTFDLTGATLDVGESTAVRYNGINRNYTPGTQSRWYTFTPATTGFYDAGMSLDPGDDRLMVEVYTDETTYVGLVAPSGGTNLTAGTTYYLRVVDVVTEFDTIVSHTWNFTDQTTASLELQSF